MLKKIIHFFYQLETTRKGNKWVRICRLPVFIVRFKESKTKYCLFGIPLVSVKKELNRTVYSILGFKKKVFDEKEINTISKDSLIQMATSSSMIAVFDLCFGGGTETYFFSQKDALISQHPILRIQYINEKYKLTLYTQKSTGTLWAKDIAFLKEIKFAEVIVNHLIGYPNIKNLLSFILSLKQQTSRISARIHDYFSICPYYNFMIGNIFCGGPETEKCIACFQKDTVKEFPLYTNKNTDIVDWRNMWHNFYKQIDEIVVFSNSTACFFQKVYPYLKNITIIPHSVSYLRPITVTAHAGINIGVLGSIVATSKGKDILAQMESKLKDYNNIHLVVIGEFANQSNATLVTGKYNRSELPDLLEKHQIDIVLIPSVCPETFSYTTAEAMMMQLPVACFNIGAPVERVSQYEKGLVISKIDAVNKKEEVVITIHW